MLISILVVLIWSIGILLSVALLTLMERKLLGGLQRRLGPDTVGYVGLLQPISDAIKLITKQTSSTENSQFGLFYIAPMWALIVTLTGWGLITRVYLSNYIDYTYLDSDRTDSSTIHVIIDEIYYYIGLAASGVDNMLVNYGWLTILAVLSLTIYSVLLLGWSANSSYSLVGSLRSSSALVSYELILASSALLPMVVCRSYNLTDLINHQQVVAYILPLLPVGIILYISVLAETSRVPFDLVEAESELVSGYMTEHASVAFVLLFLNEYASILLFSTIISILFLGPTSYMQLALYVNINLTIIILARAVLPRIRYDQLILTCWLKLLPLIFSIMVMVTCLTLALLT
jgi:NADH-ubiquinone oxidoreductase chain 1